MRIFLVLAALASSSFGETCRVLINGTGCRTRQQAIERIFEKLPAISKVTILPRRAAPADNQRVFILESVGPAASKEYLITALGRRAKYYEILNVTPASSSS
ncbi:MAG: hypothetical protein H7Y36_05360 [Armatimonadetes bacterium]|nr:hypothetical protein [Akkermansiaceae bacterium]